jgi:hypothetical protein
MIDYLCMSIKGDGIKHWLASTHFQEYAGTETTIGQNLYNK